MSMALQYLIVSAIVGVALLYALWRYVPGLKKWLAPKLTAILRGLHLISPQQEMQLAAKLGSSGGCGSCDSCGACAPKSSRRAP